MSMYYFAAVILLSLSLWEPGDGSAVLNCPGMSQEAKGIMLIVRQNLNITSFTGVCTPVYRLDLPKNYIAYYVVLTDTDFVIISAGKKTEECKIIVQGELPSPITVMDKVAEDANKKCDRYYILAETGEMVCKDKKGKTVASNYDEDDLKQILKDHGSLDKFLADRAKDWKKDWKNRAKRCKPNKKNEKTGEVKGEKTNKEKRAKKSKEGIDCHGLTPGETHSIALRDGDTVAQVQIEYLSQDQNGNAAANAAALQPLCASITGCSVQNGVGVISPNPVDIFDLVLSVEAPAEALFNVVIKYTQGADEEHCFQVMSGPEGKTRYYTSWSGFTYRWIKSSWLFPKYCGFWYGNCYYFGGPTAWAQVFGYYDRWTLLGAHCLYTSAWNGVSTSYSCYQKAPYYRDTRMTHYIRYLAGIVRMSCNGVTYTSQMDNVKYFWRARESHGNPRIIRMDRNYLAMLQFIEKGWPVVILNKHADGSNHYSVAYGTRWRYYYYRDCHRHRFVFWSYYHCHSWVKVYDRDFYLERGHCGRYNGWYNTNNLYAAAAVY